MPTIVLKSRKVIELSESQFAKFYQAMFMSNNDITFKLNGVQFKLSDVEEDPKKALKILEENK